MSQVQVKEMSSMTVTEKNFESQVLKNSKPVVVDFWAPWCGPCKMIAPVFEKLSKELTNIDFKKVNVDENTPLAHEQGVMGLPCMIIYKDGVESARIVGYHPESKLKAQILNAVA